MVDLGVFTFRPIWLHLLHLRLQIPGWYNNATNSHGPWVWYNLVYMVSPCFLQNRLYNCLMISS